MTGLHMSTGQGGSHPIRDRGNDLYETPECATRALLECEDLPHRIWEPACGRGAISKLLIAAGHVVHSTDLVSYGFGQGERDFLLELAAPEGCEAIVTNPPFKLATEFVAHGLTLCPKVIVLCRLAFIEGAKRERIFTHCARVHAFVNRLPMMHRDGWPEDRRLKSGAVAFAWFVFERDRNAGCAELHWIRWKEAA